MGKVSYSKPVEVTTRSRTSIVFLHNCPLEQSGQSQLPLSVLSCHVSMIGGHSGCSITYEERSIFRALYMHSIEWDVGETRVKLTSMCLAKSASGVLWTV